MISIGFVVAFAAILVAIIWTSRSLSFTALGLGTLATVIGGVAQSAVALQLPVGLLPLQLALLGGALLVLTLAARRRPHMSSGPAIRGLRRRQWLLITLPTMLILATVMVSRVLAWQADGILTGLGMLSQRANIDDTARWLDITGQLASGRDLELTPGSSGGPLLVLLVVSTSLAGALSYLLVGGVNEVAVATNGPILAALILIASVPLSLAPLVEHHVGGHHVGSRGRRAIGLGIAFGVFVLAVQSTSITGVGNLGMQYALIALPLWTAAFMTAKPGNPRILISTGIAFGAGCAWPALAPLGLVALALTAIATARALTRRSAAWPALATVVAAAVVTLPGLLAGSGALMQGELRRLEPALRYTPDLTWLILVAVAGAMGSAWVLTRATSQRRAAIALAPVGLISVYAVTLSFLQSVLASDAIGVASDDIMAATVVAIAATTVAVALLGVPTSLAATHPASLAPAALIAAAALAFAATLGGIVPGAASALSPTPPSPSTGGPSWVSLVDVQSTPDQPIGNTPLGCVFLPAGAAMPSGQPDAVLAYTCTRLLVALHGLNSRAGGITDWLASDRDSDGSLWREWQPNLMKTPQPAVSTPLMLLDEDRRVTGYDTLQTLISRFPA